MLIKLSRSTSVLESSMLLNIQQPFSKLENTILIPTSPEKVQKPVQLECGSRGIRATSHTPLVQPEVMKTRGTSLPVPRCCSAP